MMIRLFRCSLLPFFVWLADIGDDARHDFPLGPMGHVTFHPRPSERKAFR